MYNKKHYNSDMIIAIGYHVKSNIGSAKSIMKNGGILENEFVDDDGEINQRYWIELD